MSWNHDERHFPLSSPYAPQDFQGVSQFLMRGAMSFSGMERAEEVQHEDDMSDDSSQMLGEKKRRLNLEQVKALEKSFESGNKLEPERKMQLARALGMQPRQIAIWFQNRRARCKNKKLEKDYDVLKRQFEALKTDNDALKSQNKNLQTQLVALRSREPSGANIIKKENEGSWGNGDGNSCDYVNLHTTSKEDSKVYPQYPSNKNAVLLPFMNDTSAADNLAQFLNGSSGQDHNHHVQICQKTDRVPTTNEGFCNMYGGIEENPEFWTWSEQPNFR